MTDAACTAGAPAAQVVRWVHEAAHGQIHGFNVEGRVVFAIAVGPQFGQQLASAFGATMARPVVVTCEPADPAARYANSASLLASVAASQARG